MDDVEKNVAIIFDDAAECECAICRDRRLTDIKNFYLVLKDDSLGMPTAPERHQKFTLAPPEIKRAILERSPESLSTWVRVNGNDWTCVKPSSLVNDVNDVFDDVFRTTFRNRLKQLHYVLEALGCKRTKLISSERRSVLTESSTEQTGKASVSHPTAEGSLNEKVSAEQLAKYELIIKQELCQEFSQHDAFDVSTVAPILEEYGFANDPVLRGILDAEKLGRRGPANRVSYSFSGEFVGDITAKLSCALNLSAKIHRLPAAASVDTALDECRRQHEEIMQTLCIEIDNA